MPDQNSRMLFDEGLARLNKTMHSFGPNSPRKKMYSMMRQQGSVYDPDSPVGMDLMKKRNPGRSITPYDSFPRPKAGIVANPPSEPFAKAGTGMAYVPEKLGPHYREDGRPMIINHEYEHAYGQPLNMPFPFAEVAPVLGDIVFGSENFRRQERKPLSGKIPIGYKNQDAEWMRSQAQKHGYFDGRSMQSLLNTPEGVSYIKQAALGPYRSDR